MKEKIFEYILCINPYIHCLEYHLQKVAYKSIQLTLDIGF